TLVQLVFGAMYRHTRDLHALWGHASFAMIALVAALMAGFAALSAPPGFSPLTDTARRIGRVMMVLFGAQFALGWVVLALGGRGFDPGSIHRALLRSGHHANGAVLLGLATWMATLARRIPKK